MNAERLLLFSSDHADDGGVPGRGVDAPSASLRGHGARAAAAHHVDAHAPERQRRDACAERERFHRVHPVAQNDQFGRDGRLHGRSQNVGTRSLKFAEQEIVAKQLILHLTLSMLVNFIHCCGSC